MVWKIMHGRLVRKVRERNHKIMRPCGCNPWHTIDMDEGFHRGALHGQDQW